MQIGTQEEIDKAYEDLAVAEDAAVLAKLRIRALKGEGLMQTGDSFPSRSVSAAMDSLMKEFGNRNLRPF
jgi:hypothetical protein